MNNVVVLPGGSWQKGIVKFLQGKGHKVHVVNPISNQTTKSADGHIVADVEDLDKMLIEIKKLNPVFIVSDQSDIATFIVAVLNQRMGLPGNDPKVVETFRDKAVMQQFASKIGMKTPVSTVVRSFADLEGFSKNQPFPIVIKPVDATNSRGFRKALSTNELKYCYKESIKYSRSKTLIAQEFVKGTTQITLDGACSNSFHCTLAASIKGPYFKPGLTSFVKYPCNIDKILLAKIIEVNNNFVTRTGLNFGLTHAEYIVDGENFWLIEIAARGAGGGITDCITGWVSGVCPYEILYSNLIGKPIDLSEVHLLKRSAILQFYHEDVMRNVPVDENIIRSIPGVAAFNYNFKKDQFVTDYYNPRHTSGIYIAENDEELEAVINKVNRAIFTS